ncbi:hypothetical protein P9J64_00095 [Deltaproteobacteria bacterium IMCC39524]|nr:hypothetical protein [Deltaproteobacteria bacterium IMCC39524]
MVFRTLLVAVSFILLFTAMAHADMNAYIHDLNVSVQGDIGGYKTKLGVRFGTSKSQVEAVFRSVESPAEVAVVLWLGEQSRQSLDTVLKVYRSQKPQGWGAMAKSLGIKPGSAAFHALKQGDIQLSMHTGTSQRKGGNKKTKKSKHG